MDDVRNKKPDTTLREEFIKLIHEIREDLIRQPANRIEDDFYPTKDVFLRRGQSEREHRKWYDKSRHRHMRDALLDFYNNLNPGHKLAQIEHAEETHNQLNAIYPKICWQELACHAAVLGVEELAVTEKHIQAQGNALQSQDEEAQHQRSDLSPIGDTLTFDQVANMIRLNNPDKTMPTIRESLERLCRVRKNKQGPINRSRPEPLYKKGTTMRDIYIVGIDDTSGRFLFQRMSAE